MLTDEDIEKCREKATASYKRHYYSTRGQQVTAADDPEMHLIWEVIAAYEAKLQEQEPVDLYGTFKAILLKSANGQLSYYNQDQFDYSCSEMANKYSEVAKQLRISLYLHPTPIQVTCQIYGHVVGACSECNTHAENDVNETNKVLADNYLKLTCGNPVPIPEGWQPIQMRDQIKQLTKENARLRAALELAAEQIRKCDYTPARSTLLEALKR